MRIFSALPPSPASASASTTANRATANTATANRVCAGSTQPGFDPTDPKVIQILTAAKEVFMDRGYAETSMDQVSHQAGVSKTTLYTRFASKEALFAGVVWRECERKGFLFDPAEMLRLPIEDGLYRIGRRLIDIMVSPEKRRAEQILAAESGRFPELIRIFMDAGPASSHAIMAQYFAGAMDAGQIKRDDPDLMARLFGGMLESIGCPYAAAGFDQTPSEAERDEHARKTARILLRGIAGDPA